MANIQELENVASQVRRDIIRMVHAVNSGHPGGSLGCTEYFVSLYFEVMNHKKSFTMDGIGEDVFFLSNGHISPVYYSTLAHAGYFAVSELASFRKIDSRLQGHPTTHEKLPGVRIASGSLGQGMSVAIGAATAKKMNNDDSLVFSLHGDGELQEGQIWEAALFASANNVDNLISTIDVNGQQIDGSTDDVMNMGSIKKKFEAFGWDVMDIDNGNDMASVIEGLNKAKMLAGKGRPVCVLLHTEMGYGVDFMVGTHEWHGKAPNDELAASALSQLAETLGDY